MQTRRLALPTLLVVSLSAVLVASLLAALLVHPAAGQSAAQIVDPSVDYTFGEHLEFRATLQGVDTQDPAAIQSATLFFDVEGSTRTFTGNAAAAPVEGDTWQLSYTHPSTEPALRAFAQVVYHFEVSLANGQKLQSQAQTFTYDDNRFTWEARSEGQFTVHWYSGDVAFAQQVLDVAQAGLEATQDLLPLPEANPVDIYVYATAQEMQATLSRTSADWVAGHADSDLGVMVVVLPSGPEQRLTMEQRIPHELMHIRLYQATGDGYAHLPPWLREGLASVSELYPNPDYQLLLDNAHTKDSLLPVSSLCQPFPRDASGAVLAYAQSASFTRYLYSSYGASGLQRLVEQYADGLSCDRAPRQALGLGLAQLERGWRQATFAEDPGLTALRNLLPWFVLALAALGAPLLVALTRLRLRVS